MTVDIKKILKDQGWKLERESGTAFFFNHAPWIAPKAYLHIVFKGAAPSALNDVGDLLHLPDSWRQMLAIQNGAILFSGSLSVYGVHASGALLNRRDVFEQLPYSIISENRSWPMKDRDRFVVLGGYDYDGSRAVLDTHDGSVIVVPRKHETILNRWQDTNLWLTEELRRLSLLFGDDGKIRVSEEDTLPTRKN